MLDSIQIGTESPYPGKQDSAATSPSTALRVAIVDRESGFVSVLVKRFEESGWQQRTLAAAVPPEELVAMRVSALVIDPLVLGPRAWEYLEEVCGSIPGLAVVVCSGPSTVVQRVRGLRLGADDWVTKPCHAEEVLARVEAVVRRHRRARMRTDVGPQIVGEVEIRPDQFQAFVGGQSASLTRREFELLQLLASSNSQVLEREDIYQRVWGYAMARGDRSVDVYVRKLRRKLQRLSPNWGYIHTHFGIGYRFHAAPLDSNSISDLGPDEHAVPSDAAGQRPL